MTNAKLLELSSQAKANGLRALNKAKSDMEIANEYLFCVSKGERILRESGNSGPLLLTLGECDD